MRCAFCGYKETKVIDSRESEDGVSIRRRRECEGCKHRFTTFETIEIKLKVVKRDGEKQNYSHAKLLNGINRACSNRSFSEEDINNLVAKIEQDIYAAGRQEVSSEKIGDIVLRHLKGFDEVAYVRFASVYKSFGSVEDFYKELLKVKHK